MIETIIFSSFAFILLFSGLMTVFSSQPIRSALWLVLAFFSAAVLWILLAAEFLGLVLILVYVGAVLTLFLFVIMTVSTESIPTLSRFHRAKHYGLPMVLGGIWLSIVVYALHNQFKDSLLDLSGGVAPLAQEVSNAQALGHQLYTQYIYPFELAGILLLVAIIASISVSHTAHPHSQVKPMSQSKQLTIRREDRIKLVQGD